MLQTTGMSARRAGSPHDSRFISEDEETADPIIPWRTGEGALLQRIRLTDRLQRVNRLIDNHHGPWCCTKIWNIVREVFAFEETSSKLHSIDKINSLNADQLESLQATIKRCVEALDDCLGMFEEIEECERPGVRNAGCKATHLVERRDLAQARRRLEELVAGIEAMPVYESDRSSWRWHQDEHQEPLLASGSTTDAHLRRCLESVPSSPFDKSWMYGSTLPSRDIDDDSRASTSDQCSPVNKASAPTRRDKATHSCYYIIFAAVLLTIASAAFGVRWAIRKQATGDGFTVASYILAVGATVLVPWTGYHYNHCTCWRRHPQGPDDPPGADIALDDCQKSTAVSGEAC